MARGDQFWLPKLVRPDRFWQQKWSGGPILAKFSAKIGPAGPILGGTDFGVTAQWINFNRKNRSVLARRYCVFLRITKRHKLFNPHII